MAFSQDDIDIALEYAETVRLTATLNPSDHKTIDFKVSKDIPDTIKDQDVKDLLDIAIKYYQRSIFTGEYLMADEDPPIRPSGEPIDDINFFLSYYKNHLTEELSKAFDMNDEMKIEEQGNGPKMTPYAQAMLDYQKARKKGKK